jgi:hypothetical protein
MGGLFENLLYMGNIRVILPCIGTINLRNKAKFCAKYCTCVIYCVLELRSFRCNKERHFASSAYSAKTNSAIRKVLNRWTFGLLPIKEY